MLLFSISYIIVVFICFFDIRNIIFFKKRKLLRLEGVYKNVNYIEKENIKNKSIVSSSLYKLSFLLSKLKIFNVYGNSEEKKYIDIFGMDYSYFLSIKICSSLFFIFVSILFSLLFGFSFFYYIFICIFFCFVGFKFPNFVFNQKRKLHLSRVEMGMADALDLFLVCAEAGLAMESAMECVAVEMILLNKDVAEEFKITIDEMRINSDRVKVIEDLGKRTGLIVMKRLSGALIQTFETGSSLVSVLRVLVSEIREDSLIRFEERAAKLSVILTFPMIIFLLPCIFIIIAGPAVLGIIGVLKE
ncbi:type II secretion system F family protein [Acetobacter sp.]|jgi:pilus assembly protein TadC|uniref:type II secretion system F family protein n=1 Tax=Acetobacter sp. TaxID=440 RepID=UPI0025C6D693|nr:type II secretion system F family protein [Acetobacter sp.]MCH4090143.1 type II secretion system F family protein [Acetobacter sp.]MCI1298838.1 type II secretion system F family protein [Acetobacter sp.]MCI1314858.1 type II secretion system F family protein [Acetobacter sp.]